MSALNFMFVESESYLGRTTISLSGCNAARRIIESGYGLEDALNWQFGGMFSTFRERDAASGARAGRIIFLPDSCSPIRFLPKLRHGRDRRQLDELDSARSNLIMRRARLGEIKALRRLNMLDISIR